MSADRRLGLIAYWLSSSWRLALLPAVAYAVWVFVSTPTHALSTRIFGAGVFFGAAWVMFCMAISVVRLCINAARPSIK